MNPAARTPSRIVFTMQPSPTRKAEASEEPSAELGLESGAPSSAPASPLERVPALRAAREALRARPQTWLITGGAGFIGSHLLDELLTLGQHVTVLDNLTTGFARNLDTVRAQHPHTPFTFMQGDVRDAQTLQQAATGAHVIVHLAAQVSVPRSVDDPETNFDINVRGTEHVIAAAITQHARVVFAGSSASYGDDPRDIKLEDHLGQPLSPYAQTKTTGEQLLKDAHTQHALETVALRFFNVFGPRQDPNGPYAAVIPAWITRTLAGQPCLIHGDGTQTRDFCFVTNVVGAIVLAATRPASSVAGRAYNIGTGEPTSLLALHTRIAEAARARGVQVLAPTFGPARAGDIQHSCASITRARAELAFEPVVSLAEGVNAMFDAGNP